MNFIEETNQVKNYLKKKKRPINLTISGENDEYLRVRELL